MNDQVTIDITHVYRPCGISPEHIHGEAWYHGLHLRFKLQCDPNSTEAISFGIMAPQRMSFDFLPKHVRMRHFDTRDMIPYIKDKIVNFVEHAE